MRTRIARLICLTLIPLAAMVGAATASADTMTVTRSDGYQVTLTGPSTATVGSPTMYTATCGPIGWYGSPCPYGEFRAFGGPINRLGEGFGTGAQGSYVFRAAGAYQIRYRVGASCIGSPRQQCPIDVWLNTSAG
jgi:hypothetical protein